MMPPLRGANAALFPFHETRQKSKRCTQSTNQTQTRYHAVNPSGIPLLTWL